MTQSEVAGGREGHMVFSFRLILTLGSWGACWFKPGEGLCGISSKNSLCTAVTEKIMSYFWDIWRGRLPSPLERWQEAPPVGVHGAWSGMQWYVSQKGHLLRMCASSTVASQSVLVVWRKSTSAVVWSVMCSHTYFSPNANFIWELGVEKILRCLSHCTFPFPCTACDLCSPHKCDKHSADPRQ